jgi:hypothetical protein
LSIGISFLLAAYYFFKGQELDRKGIRLEGTVTNYWTEEDNTGEEITTDHYLKAYFTDAEKYVHTVELQVPGNVYREGKKTMAVKLIYPPEQPKKARAEKALYTPAIIWGLILTLSSIFYVLYFTLT